MKAIGKVEFHDWGCDGLASTGFGIVNRLVDSEHDAYPEEVHTFPSSCVACGGTAVSPPESDADWFWECVMCGFGFTLPRVVVRYTSDADTPWRPGCDRCGKPLYLVRVNLGRGQSCWSAGHIARHRLVRRACSRRFSGSSI